ncbi:MAG: hypothetical protein BMS9Abin19_0763 [Gammaproteobacteria bacterium]|nr:MAG: hypothetical protein BMS9Abin19_0763 [Gammaproteobacteria bacterium]
MYKFKAKKYFYSCLLLVFLLSNAPVLLAQRIVDSGVQSAGFRFSTDKAAAVPIIHYQQNIQMLSGVDDRPSLKVFGSGRVVVHYPAYMKKAGDYEMQLSIVELVALIHSLSSNGIMDFDEKKITDKIKIDKKASIKKGEYYKVSDSVESVVDIRLDEYQKNTASVKLKGFSKHFKWKNIEHDAIRFKNVSEVARANLSIVHLKALMKDARLVKRVQR